MKALVLLAVSLLMPICVAAQSVYRLNDASKSVDVGIEVGSCDLNSGLLCGPLTVRFYHKGKSKAFQTIHLPRTQMWDAKPKANVINRYDDQSVIDFVDVDFDGHEDIAICDGNNGGYGMPSYRVYLFSPASGRFIYSRAFTHMNFLGLGMFETDKKKKMHFVFTKDGCCWHQTEGYDVVRHRPRNIYEVIQDAASPKMMESGMVEITTRKLIRGRWRSWVRHVKAN